MKRNNRKCEDLIFVKSSASQPGGVITRCVEVARTATCVVVRNSNDPAKKTVQFTHDEWSAFLKGANLGEFNVG